MIFVLAITLNPEVQRKAQVEIDSVIGSDRLPNMSDQDSLPYVNAIIQEVVRWQPVTPIGVSLSGAEWQNTYKLYFKGFRTSQHKTIYIEDILFPKVLPCMQPIAPSLYDMLISDQNSRIGNIW